ncbi:ImmA/IrrE family metallo-endopeptidase [Virgisporangium ochraceum]|uniref:ImmA/IrrE family metallo-endopeptidase n=1 Tax=Virgisporangium ochraceum TaxID=65505 RepID=UPI0019419219|nr:ImmA/IrrE family metallo-endopeptidase [Virgisporangium ochraceum]
MKSSEVATKLGWPASKQTRLEYSERAFLDPEQLAIISSLLQFPEKYFLEPPPPPVTIDDLLFRAPVATPKKEKAYLAEFARAVGEVLEWLDGRHRLPAVKIPTLPADTSMAEAGKEVRRALSLPDDQPIPHLIHLMERAGVPVIVRGNIQRMAIHDPEDLALDAVTEKHLGYSTRVGEHADRPVTVLRANPSWERVRWTVAHELGHITLHSRGLTPDSENQASAFASELLAPASAVRKELPAHVTLASLTEVKLRWGISLGALITHLHANNLVDAERFETLRRQLYTRMNSATGRSWGRDEPGWDAREIERPRLLVTWMERCLGIAVPHAVAQMSGIWPADLVASMISGQRPKVNQPESVGPPTPKPDNVISLDRWRLREA